MHFSKIEKNFIKNAKNNSAKCSPTKILLVRDEAPSWETSTEGSSSSDDESDKITHTQWIREDDKWKKLQICD